MSEDNSDMPPEDRREEVLDFMAEHKIPLPPKVVYRGMKIQRGINFSYGTVQNAITDLVEQGLLVRVDKKALDEGELETVPIDQTGIRAYYMISEEGVKSLSEK